MKKANCFENTARYMIDKAIEDPKTTRTLVHCRVVGRGGYVVGEQYAHAFVIEHGHAIDNARDYFNPVIIPLDVYRKLGNVTDEIHYTLKETRKMIHEAETYGPWATGLSTDFERAQCEGAAID